MGTSGSLAYDSANTVEPIITQYAGMAMRPPLMRGAQRSAMRPPRITPGTPPKTIIRPMYPSAVPLATFNWRS